VLGEVRFETRVERNLQRGIGIGGSRRWWCVGTFWSGLRWVQREETFLFKVSGE
jgi:hypothetical protein